MSWFLSIFSHPPLLSADSIKYGDCSVKGLDKALELSKLDAVRVLKEGNNYNCYLTKDLNIFQRWGAKRLDKFLVEHAASSDDLKHLGQDQRVKVKDLVEMHSGEAVHQANIQSILRAIEAIKLNKSGRDYDISSLSLVEVKDLLQSSSMDYSELFGILSRDINAGGDKRAELLNLIPIEERVKLFTALLDEWETGGDKVEAVKRILKALKNNSNTLDLKRLDLTSLPECIGLLSSLETLNLDSNNLTSVPEGLGNLISLKILTLNSNDLISIPLAIFKLRALTELHLKLNRLQSIPNQINELVNLCVLCYSYNEVRLAPNITLHLRQHDNVSNPFIDSEDSGWEPAQARISYDSVTDCLSLIGEAAGTSLQEGLDLNPLGPEKDGTLHLWLMSCIDSKEWNDQVTKEEFAKGLLEIVKYAASNEEYRETFSNVLSDRSCSDRATLAYDTLKLNLEIARLGKEATMGEVIALFRRDFVAKQLDVIALELDEDLKKRDPQYDQISASLSLRQEVGRRLNIRIGSQNMFFVNLSYLKEEDYQKAKNQVEEALKNTDLVADHFVGHSAWKSYLDAKFPESKEQALVELHGRMRALEEADETDEDYLSKVRDLKVEFDQAEKAWYLTKTKELLDKDNFGR